MVGEHDVDDLVADRIGDLVAPSPMTSILRIDTAAPVNSSDVAPRAAVGGPPTAAANESGVSCT